MLWEAEVVAGGGPDDHQVDMAQQSTELLCTLARCTARATGSVRDSAGQHSCL